MGLFGKDWSNRLSTIGAGLQDVGSSLGHEQGGYLNQYQAQQRALQDKAKQDAAYTSLHDILTPKTPPAAGIPADTANLSPYAAAMQGLAQGGHTGPSTPQAQSISWDQLLPALVNAQQAGIDTTGILKGYQQAHPTKEYQGVNLGDGNFGSFDPTTGQITDLRTDPYAAKRGELLDAQIAAQKAYIPLRDAQGDYYQAKAKQPYAPPRKSTRGAKSVGHQLPPGAVLIP